MCDRICKTCGGDDKIAKIGEAMGFRPDVAFLRIKRLEAALKRISKWHGEFPDSGSFWDEEKTKPMNYSAAFGSNGERDFMRKVAQDALDR